MCPTLGLNLAQMCPTLGLPRPDSAPTNTHARLSSTINPRHSPGRESGEVTVSGTGAPGCVDPPGLSRLRVEGEVVVVRLREYCRGVRMRVSSKGRVVTPKEIPEKYGLCEGTEATIGR